MKYAVRQWYIDPIANGKEVTVLTSRVVKATDDAVSIGEEHERYYYYFDVFNTREEAEEYRQECLEDAGQTLEGPK